MSFLDLFSQHAAVYAQYRPAYPPELYAFLAAQTPGHARALDCATGSGQAARGLTAHFERVLACDASASQLAHADRGAGVAYFCSPVERLPLPEASLDLLTVAQAAHWFDLEPFYAEARRVLRPGGLLALWGYHLLEVDPAVDAVLGRLFHEITGPYWHPNRALVDDKYAHLPFPFPELPAPQMEMRTAWRLPALLGFVTSWSATQAFQREHGYNPLQDVETELLAAWGDPDRSRPLRWPLFFKLARMEAA